MRGRLARRIAREEFCLVDLTCYTIGLHVVAGVIEFELGDCGVRYGGTGLKFTSDDCRWTLKK